MLVIWGEIPEASAQGEIALLYEDIRQTLAVEHVPSLYRVLATEPDALADLWAAFQPFLESLQASQFSSQVTQLASEFALRQRLPLIHLPSPPRNTIRYLLDSFNRANPRTWLFSTAARHTLRHVRRPNSLVWRLDPAADATASVPRELRKTLEDIRALYGSAAVPGIYRALAAWPDALRAFWGIIRPLHESGTIPMARAQLAALAEATVRSWPNATVEYSRPISDQLAPIVDWFFSANPTAILEIECMKQSTSAV
jgi:hypothetical protein